MSFVPGQRPWSQLNSNWQGIFDTAAELPNVAGSSLQMGVPNVQTGDLAYVDGVGLYTCHDPTAGAAVWALVSGSSGGGIVGPANAVYLEPAPKGNDATGQRGNAAQPFATLAGAVAAMINGDQLRVAPGFYIVPATVTMPNDFTMFAYGAIFAYTGVAGGSIFARGNANGGFYIAGASFDASSDPSDNVYFIDGTGGGGGTLNDGGQFFQCQLRGGASSGFCGSVSLIQCRLRDGGYNAVTATLKVRDCVSDGASLNLTWGASADAPPRQPNTVENFTGDPPIAIAGTVQLIVDSLCRLSDIQCPAALVEDASGVPYIEVHGRFSTSTIILPDTVTNITVDYTNCDCGAFADFEVAAPAANFKAVICDGMLLRSGAPNSLIARDGIDLRVFSDGIQTPAVYSTPGTGTITPSTFIGTVTLAGAANVLAFGFNAGSAPYAVATPDNNGAGALGVVPTASNVTVSPAVPGAFNAQVVARWN